MVSDEMTTGGMRSSHADKRQFAADSHAWNLKNAKYKTIFPDYATPELKRLPNMGESDRGNPDGPPLPKNLGNPDGTPAADALADKMSSTSLQGSYVLSKAKAAGGTRCR
jgi:ubiquitin-conjugating enzyme E2 J2